MSCLARPSAKKPAERSSSTGIASMPGCSANANASGVDRDPGETTARLTPDLNSVSAATLPQRAFTLRMSSAGGFMDRSPGGYAPSRASCIALNLSSVSANSVSGEDPETEFAETELKFKAMQDALPGAGPPAGRRVG